MAKDLTKFPFNVVNFIHSENVMAMSADEVGQFVLLLCQSWLLDKDASLPTDSAFIQRVCRSDAPSEAVLRLFPVIQTEHGERRRNTALFREWTKALEDVETISERNTRAANIKWAGTGFKKFADGLQVHDADAVHVHKHASRDREESIDNISQEIREEKETLDKSQIEKLDFPNGLQPKKAWRACEEIWRKDTREKLIPLGRRFHEFEEMVETYGSAHVIAAFDLWVRERGEGFTPKFAGSAFLKNAQTSLDAVRVLSTPEEVVPGVETDDQLRIRMEKKLADEAIQDEIDRKKREADEKFELENRDQI